MACRRRCWATSATGWRAPGSIAPSVIRVPSCAPRRRRPSTSCAALRRRRWRGRLRRRAALHVEVGGIGAKTALASPELTQRLREFLTRELERTPGLTFEGAPRDGFLIDSAITSISRRTTSDYVEISCEVSLIVGKLPSKAMVMMTSGGASMQTPKVGFRPEREKAMQVDVLEGAVHSAHENLLAFLKSQEHL